MNFLNLIRNFDVEHIVFKTLWSTLIQGLSENWEPVSIYLYVNFVMSSLSSPNFRGGPCRKKAGSVRLSEKINMDRKGQGTSSKRYEIYTPVKTAVPPV